MESMFLMFKLYYRVLRFGGPWLGCGLDDFLGVEGQLMASGFRVQGA